MSALTAIIAEDEAPQRAELCALLADVWPELVIKAKCADGDAAKAALAQHQPDVAFLDIRMPGASGLDVARTADPSTSIVMTTAYDQFAVNAFEQGAIDYLLKPIQRDRLVATVARITQRRASNQPIDMPRLLSDLEQRLARPVNHLKWITARTGGIVRMVPVEEVLFFQAQDKYTRVVTAADEALVRTSLRELVAQLDPDCFWQVHRGTIVQLSAIEEVRRDEDGKLQLLIKGKTERIPVSSTFAARFKSM